ncbi:MAG TPA: T9SS type A sorting domain-containing protein, partial [Candidatus Kapabacteria bacterium]|nr:T9SS type A sorting domain-containing protein [Candidatus Kapabacteria bacterium]
DTLNRHASRYYQVFPPAGATTEAFDFTPSDVTTHFKLELVVRNGTEVTVIPFTDHVCLPLSPMPDAIFAVVMNTDSVGGTNKYRLRITQGIQLQKSAPVSTASGSALTYTITITNKSARDLRNVVLIDSLPIGAQFQNASDGGDTVNRNVKWNLPTIAAGANKSVTYTVMLTGCSTVYNYSYSLTADSVPLICGAPVKTGISPSAGQKYTVTDLGGLYSYSTGEPAGSAAHSINNRGEVTGEAYALPNTTYPTYAPTHGFLWRNGVMTDLGTFDGPGLGPDSYGSSINDNGQIAGFTDVVVGTPPFISYYPHAFIANGGGNLSDIGFLPTAGQYPYANGYGLNNKGQVVGTCADSTITGGTSAFFYSGGSMTRLNALAESYDSVTYAYAINNKGQAVGNSDSAGYSRAVMWDNGGAPQRLGMLPGGAYYASGATGINDNGQIVGWCDSLGPIAGEAYIHAVLWDHGTVKDLGSLYGYAQAKAINNKGDIVGYSYPPNVQPQNGQYLDEYGTAFILPHNGRIMKLDSLTPAGCESFNDAVGINDSGQVIAYVYKLNEYKESFIVTPIGSSSAVQENLLSSSVPENLLVMHNYPNPFREQTTVTYSIGEQGNVTVEVVDMLGETVANVFSGRQAAGTYNMSVDAARFLPGVYFCKVTLNGKTTMHPMVVVK